MFKKSSITLYQKKEMKRLASKATEISTGFLTCDFIWLVV